MESLSGLDGVTFEVLRARLVKQVKLRIDNGEFTERGLSRILGISQSQTHNVLKGARTLQPQLADRMLAKLGLSALDLLTEYELDAAMRSKLDQGGIAEIYAPKKPVARSAMSDDEGLERKTG